MVHDIGTQINFGKSTIPSILKKYDGVICYDTTDIAAVYYRMFHEKVDTIICVIDSGQTLHFNTLFEVAEN